MEENKPKGSADHPLTETLARKILVDLAENNTGQIRWSRHVKMRMIERGITSRQILTVLKSRHSVFREGPFEAINGDWKLNISGMAAGTIIQVTLAIENFRDDPAAVVVTVWIE
ncbi:hypothetical protein C9927_00315 [Pseudidiomarina aestuarii]|uniref:DUF4258 domain-containing protein n=1 Tax=Pseudidiomarina aestuarii TaxID=624146 RepID=A0A2T4CTV9_9GAMM|nr:hypothetical protein C9988_03095 [Pseudidiomarina aestuarii]PTB87423.1 hypothetical protein C9939_01310 [Pseudidiomarina aestuarii]PTB89505.1 hypothetical protein C9928_03305 [Pseudidiomarina aestuarii]PTB90442.1 hypothetical protein C9927_00315 [Pseudidiomarina aestuarii]